MDFDFSDDQQQLRDAVRRWVDKGYTFERRRAIVAAGGFERAAYGELAELGLTALTVPEAHGGLDLSQVTSFDTFKEVTVDKVEALVRAFDEYQKANARNPIPVDIRLAGEKLGLFQQQFQYVYDMMALGNTTLFLDIFPLHAFYANVGLRS